jgi:hypothetical protein
MSIEEFNDTRFGNGMKVIYRGEENDIVSVDFEESLIGIGIEGGDDGEIHWVRCENVTLVNR